MCGMACWVLWSGELAFNHYLFLAVPKATEYSVAFLLFGYFWRKWMSLPAAFSSVILIWSTTPLAIKWSALGVGFSFAVLSRMVIGTMLCWALLLILRVRFPLHRQACLSYLACGLSMFLAMTLTYWSAQYVNSGLISVMFGLSPLITSLAAALWL